MEDLGAPVSHLVLKDGVPVYDPGGERIGVVDQVIADEITGIFEGLVIHTLPLPGRHVFASYDQIRELHERGVLLAVGPGELHELDEESARRRAAGEAPESPLQAALRKAWDWLTGVR
jgi:uncharacterized protein YrrD